MSAWAVCKHWRLLAGTAAAIQCASTVVSKVFIRTRNGMLAARLLFRDQQWVGDSVVWLQ
jgi:hypothetical protein